MGPECREENRPFSGQQHQAQFGLNPTLVRVGVMVRFGVSVGVSVVDGK